MLGCCVYARVAACHLFVRVLVIIFEVCNSLLERLCVISLAWAFVRALAAVVVVVVVSSRKR